MNSKKIAILLVVLIFYVNYSIHFKKDISKIEQNIFIIKGRILTEKKLFLNRKKYLDINLTKDYSYLFFDSKKKSYSTSMGEFQQLLEVNAKKNHCTIVNTQWQDVPIDKNRTYDILSLKLILECRPKDFIFFQNTLRDKKKLFVFNSLYLRKNRKNNFLNIDTTVYAFRSRENEK